MSLRGPGVLATGGHLARTGEEVFGSVSLGTIPRQTKSLLPQWDFGGNIAGWEAEANRLGR